MKLFLATLVSLLPLLAADPAEVLRRIRSNDTAWLSANIQSKEDANARDPRQNTPLLWASALGSTEAVQLLLQKGSDPNAENAFGVTPLIAAATEPAKVKLLLAAGANAKAVSKSGHHALTVAATAPHATESLKLLLAAGAPLEQPGAIAMTPLLASTFFVCSENNLKTLLVAHASAKPVSALGFNAAHGMTNCSPALIHQAIQSGADPNQANLFLGKARHGDVQLKGLTPLHLAAAHRDAKAVSQLLNDGANVNAKDVRGMTPLLAAVSSEDQNAEVVKLLLAKGADRSAKDQFGQDAVAWARKFNNPAVLAVLGEKPAPKTISSLDKRGPGASAALAVLESSNESFFKESGCLACHASNLISFAAARAAQAKLPVNTQLAETRRTRLKGLLAGNLPTYLQQIGPPGDIDNTLYSLFEARALGLESTPDLELAAKYVLSRQLESGEWSMRGISRSPIEESNLHRTAIALYVVPHYLPASLQAFAQPRLASAGRWLAAQPARTTDELASKLLGLHWSKAGAAQIQAAAKQLEAAQLKDGSWGGNPHLSGDAYSTGLALFALREAAQRPTNAKSVQSAVRWLLATQAADGTWHVKSRAVKFQPYFESGFPYGPDQWISSGGTAWAVAALASAGAAN